MGFRADSIKPGKTLKKRQLELLRSQFLTLKRKFRVQEAGKGGCKAKRLQRGCAKRAQMHLQYYIFKFTVNSPRFSVFVYSGTASLFLRYLWYLAYWSHLSLCMRFSGLGRKITAQENQRTQEDNSPCGRN
jgi:hypothetical protein